jgi:hypothetical protein
MIFHEPANAAMHGLFVHEKTAGSRHRPRIILPTFPPSRSLSIVIWVRIDALC